MHSLHKKKTSIFHLQLKVPDGAGLSQDAVKVLYSVHYKFLFIPVMFVLLRIWTCILNVLLIYVQMPLPCGLLFTLTLLSVSGCGYCNQFLCMDMRMYVKD